jgi:CubicO group peptidase (beta-lactamase class C family)
LPLLAQPGEAWHYNTGAQVLGVLVERAAGRPFEAFLAERVFGPLGMGDTAFSVSPADLHRLTTAYAPDPVTGALSVLDERSDSWWSVPPAMPNGAGWLVSTVDDFAAFAAMLADGGRGGGGRILSDAAVHAMTSDHLRSDQRAANRLFLGGRGGWGYGMRVPSGAGSRPVGSTAGGAPGGAALRGGYGWDGGTGTSWRTDPDSGLTAILFTQRAMTSPQPPELFVDFWEGAVAALPG